jgi:signal transduction histidine kinase
MRIDVLKLPKKIQHRLLIVALFLIAIVLTIAQTFFTRIDLSNRIKSEAKITAQNLAAAILFNDELEMQAIISSLEQDKKIKQVNLFNKFEKPVAQLTFKSDYISCDQQYVSQIFCSIEIIDIEFKGQAYGKLVIQYSTQSVWIQTLFFLIISSLTSLLIWSVSQSTNLFWKLKIRSYEQTLKNLINKNNLLIENRNKDIALEIHDQVGQLISTSLIQLNKLEKNLSSEDDILGAKAIKSNLNETYQRVKNISKELHPVLLKFGLSVALESLAESKFAYTGQHHKIVDKTNDQIMVNDIGICLYRIAQEAYTNILKHANASEVITTLSIKNNEIIMTIKDDGNGFNTKSIDQTKSMGLIGIAERVLQIHGSVKIDSSEKGTTLITNLPLGNHE